MLLLLPACTPQLDDDDDDDPEDDDPEDDECLIDCADDSGEDDTAADTDTATDTDTGGRVAPGTLVVVPESLEFADLEVGYAMSRELEVRNVGEGTLTIDSARLTDDAGGVFFMEEIEDLDLAAGESVGWTVAATMRTQGEAEGVLRIASDDPAAPEWDVPLHAETAEEEPVEDEWVTVNWSTSGIDLILRKGARGGYYFGIADTRRGNGYIGEDCIEGNDHEDTAYGFDFCHHADETGGTWETANLSDVDEYDAYVADAGETLTAFDDVMAAADEITYILSAVNGSGCFVWGNDPAHYDAYGCTEL